MPTVTVDFITEDPWQMVLVEEGPWPDIADNLRRVQDRLYTCLDAALDGKVAELYPDSRGATITIRLDGYNLPHQAQDLFDAFSTSVLELPDYREALEASTHVSGIRFVGHFH